MEVSKPPANSRLDIANIGKSVIVKGELSGSEDLYLDGEVEGSIELRGHNLTIGPNGRVRANINARNIVVHGKFDGNAHGTERVELKNSAIFVGDITTQRIAVEDGAYFKGSIDILREGAKPQAKPESKPEAVPAAGVTAGAAVAQTSFSEVKK